MANRIINIVAILSIIAILAGLIIAIWFGLIGIRIAATGIVTFATDWLLFWWIKETKKEKAKNGTKK